METHWIIEEWVPAEEYQDALRAERAGKGAGIPGRCPT